MQGFSRLYKLLKRGVKAFLQVRLPYTAHSDQASSDPQKGTLVLLLLQEQACVQAAVTGLPRGCCPP